MGVWELLEWECGSCRGVGVWELQECGVWELQGCGVGAAGVGVWELLEWECGSYWRVVWELLECGVGAAGVWECGSCRGVVCGSCKSGSVGAAGVWELLECGVGVWELQ